MKYVFLMHMVFSNGATGKLEDIELKMKFENMTSCEYVLKKIEEYNKEYFCLVGVIEE